MATAQVTPDRLDAAYDVVGRYEQDRVNGLNDELLDGMLELSCLADGQRVLDAMGGDGNLCQRVLRYAKQRGLEGLALTLLEYSRVQCDFARYRLGEGVEVIWGDALGMVDRQSGEAVAGASFDRVLIKSANHEIPAEEQPQLHGGVHRVLADGGRLVNLGFLFDDEAERDEFREIARVKDAVAGMTAAAERRHFLTRDEYYGMLREAGFVDVYAARAFGYTICSQVVAEQYFPEATRQQDDLAHQIAQLRALRLRANGRVRFEGPRSVMRCPGEVTVARRPTALERRAQPLDIDAARRSASWLALLDRAERALLGAGSVLQLGGCGGHLAMRLAGGADRYRVVESRPEAAAVLAERLGEQGEVLEAGLASAAGEHDALVILGALGRADEDPVELLRAARRALRRGGRLLLGCARPGAFGDGSRAGCDAEASRELAGLWRPASAGQTWSLEGMLALLDHLGFRDARPLDDRALGGEAYLLTAEG